MEINKDLHTSSYFNSVTVLPYSRWKSPNHTPHWFLYSSLLQNSQYSRAKTVILQFPTFMVLVSTCWSGTKSSADLEIVLVLFQTSFSFCGCNTNHVNKDFIFYQFPRSQLSSTHHPKLLLINTTVVRASVIYKNHSIVLYVPQPQECKNLGPFRILRWILALNVIESYAILAQPVYKIWLCCPINRYTLCIVQKFYLQSGDVIIFTPCFRLSLSIALSGIKLANLNTLVFTYMKYFS